jgi:putative endonuclease
METAPQALGILGEELAFHELRRRGYKILLRNYECALGEIDLIAKEKGALVFIEVKTRSSDAMGSPAEAVTLEKRRQIVRVAKYYLKRYGISDRACRFDVVSVRMSPNKEPTIEVLESAFGEDGC